MAPVPLPTSASSLTSPSPTLQLLVPRDVAPAHTYNPGVGVTPPDKFNNKAYFALFAILGAAMVLASIWFFFISKHGGFHWEKNDWDDYKTTVLRRKGKDGKTLSNATPHTNLGEKSIAGTFDINHDRRNEALDINDFAFESQRNDGNKSHRPPRDRGREPNDDDLRAYRKERVAKVGGLNRQEDGSHFDYSSHSRSDLGSDLSSRPLRRSEQPEPTKKEKRAVEKEAKLQGKAAKKEEKQRRKENKKQQKNFKDVKAVDGRRSNPPMSQRPRHTFAADELSVTAGSSIHPGSSASQVPPRDNYFNAYRPPAPPHAASRRYEQRKSAQVEPHPASPSRSRQPSPTKPVPARRPPGSFGAYSDAGASDTGTKVYSHHIPELSRGSRDTGFRRGGGRGGRRDSLSDSDDGDLAGFRR